MSYKPLQPKSKGQLRNVSGFIIESLLLDLELFHIRKCGKKDGYWVCELLLEQLNIVIQKLEDRFCSSEEDEQYFCLLFIFDYSTNHDKGAPDALSVTKMNRGVAG